MLMTDAELGQIADHAQLWITYGNRDAFTAEDCATLLAVTDQALADHAFLVAQYRREVDRAAAAEDAAWEARLQRRKRDRYRR